MFTLHARNFFSIRSSFFLTMSISIFFLFSVGVNYSGLTVCCSLTAVWHWDGYKELRQLLRQFPAREVKFSPKEGQKARVVPQSVYSPRWGATSLPTPSAARLDCVYCKAVGGSQLTTKNGFLLIKVLDQNNSKRENTYISDYLRSISLGLTSNSGLTLTWGWS